MVVLLLGLDAGEGDGLAEGVAELHGAVPVELELAVEVALSPDLVEGDRTAARLRGERRARFVLEKHCKKKKVDLF